LNIMAKLMASTDVEMKVIIMLAIFLSGFLGVMTPRVFDPFGKRLSLANLLSSGVLLSAAMIHLLPDSASNLNLKSIPGSTYPYGYLCCAASFYILFIVERLIIEIQMHKTIDHDNSLCLNDDKITGAHCNYTHNIVHKHHNKKAKKKDHKKKHKHKHKHYNDKFICVNSETSGSHEHTSISLNEHTKLKSNQKNSCIHPQTSTVDQHTIEIVSLLQKQNYTAALILLVGLGLHSFLAGLALGSSITLKQNISIGIAIIAHKYLAALALGIPLYKSQSSVTSTLCIGITFGLITPTGVLIGWSIKKYFNEIITDIFICIACGTFIYVSICEILICEFSKEKQMESELLNKYNTNCNSTDKTCSKDLSQCSNAEKYINTHKSMSIKQEIKKMISVIIGFSLMSLLALWV